MSQVFKHLSHAALVVEAHDDEAPRTLPGAVQRRRIAPKRARPSHDGFIIAGPGISEEPDLINQIPIYFGDDVKIFQQAVIIHALGLVEAGARLPARQKTFRSVDEAVLQHGETIHFNTLGDLEIHQPVTALPHIGDVTPREFVGVVPA